MASHARWEAEVMLMANTFPTFRAFSEPGRYIGFHGHLRGPRTRRIYEVLIRASAYRYPGEEPPVFMHPHPENEHWIRDDHGGRLCYWHTERKWSPGRDTFLKTLLVAVDYLKEFD